MPGPSTDWSWAARSGAPPCCSTCCGRGKRIPQDIALVSIGEVELGPYLPVSISYVAIPRYETGKAAAELALALSRGEEIRQEVVKLR
jgi:DNA-binding LacI/PurR family transcriptional regulator